jgi:threonine/homoserine/homoserine lactone efflux protein
VSVSNLFFFAAMEIVLCFTPGPAVLLIVSQSMKRGFRPSLRGALGIVAANAFYFALSAVGLGALLMASKTVFEAIRWIGAGYLMFMGLRMILSRNSMERRALLPAVSEATAQSGEAPAPELRSMGSSEFVQALIVQLSNPKAVVFFTALLPQFIDPKGPVTLQFLTLGVISTVIEYPVLALYGFAADRGRAVYARHTRWIERIAGGCLVAAGLKLAATKA